MKSNRNMYLVVTLLMWIEMVNVHGQDTNGYEFKKWEIGLDLLTLINKNQLPAPSIFVRHSSNNNSALRLRFGGNLPINGQPAPIENIYFIRPGYERIQSFSKKASLHYGVDFFYEKYRTTLQIIDLSQIGSLRLTAFPSFRRNTGVGVFAGYRTLSQKVCLFI